MSRRIRRLLFVTDAPHFGGAEQYILSMCRAARAHDIEPRICWLPPVGASADVFAEAGGAVTSCASSAGAFRSMLRAFRPDAAIINASGRPRFWLTAWVTRLAGVPTAWVHHMVDTRDHRRLPARHLGGRVEGLQSWRIAQALRHRMAAAGADAVIVSNERDREWLLRWRQAPRNRLHVVPPGVDGERFRPQIRGSEARSHFVLGTAARLVRGKGVERILAAVTGLRGQGRRVKALIAGEGPDGPLLVDLAARLGAANDVQFVGRIGDMPGFYARLDAFALCSDTESFGLALAEAMACGLPVIATPTAGARTQIAHLGSGWLLQSFDADELAGAIVRLQDDPPLRSRLGSMARSVVLERFSSTQTFDRTIALLDRRAASGRRAVEPVRAPALATSVTSVREVA